MSKQKTDPIPLTPIQQANEQGKARLSSSTSSIEIFKILLKNKGKSLTPVELAGKLGETVTPKNVRNAMQKEGLSKHQNAVIARTISSKVYWLHLTKQTGGRNSYKLTNANVN